MKSGRLKKLKQHYFGLLVFLIAFILIAAGIYTSSRGEREKVTYLQFIELVNQGKVSQVTIKDSPEILFTAGEKNYKTDNPRNPELKECLLLKEIDVLEGGNNKSVSLAQGAISLTVMAGVIFFIYKSTSKTQGKSEVSIEISDENEKKDACLSFQDVAGNIEAKECVADVVDFIKLPEKYSAYGARMPRGLIFYGPPGTGKTLLAKAIAGEAKVPFYAVSGSDFVQMYVGVGAGRIRDLFKKARAHGKAVIFIDEIDAMGKKRGAGNSGGNDERDQTLNALLTEMSGFNSGEGIIVIAATNRLDTLDEALLRPGRFDRQIEIALPDLAAREEILKFHAGNKPLSNEIKFDELAKQTVYFSGAMLENLLNEAAIFAVRRGAKNIESCDIDQSYYTIIAGAEKKNRDHIRQKDKMITAYHEAGHAVMTKITAPENTVSKISIIPSTKGAGGFCINIPPDKMFYTKTELQSQIMIALGGRASEELFFGEENVTTGAGNDIEKAGRIVKDYIIKYGMGKGIAIDFNEDALVKEECTNLLKDLYEKAATILKENRSIVEAVANTLMEIETMDEKTLDSIIYKEKELVG